jgi:hypothetical protein
MIQRLSLSQKTIIAVFLFDALLILLHLFFGAANDLINLDKEGNIPTYYAGAKLLAVGILILLLIYRQPERTGWAWLPLGIMFVYLAADEMLELHERLTFALYPAIFAGLAWFSNHVFYWVILFLPLIILAVAYIYFLIRYFSQIPPRTKTLYFAGLGLYVAVIALEFIGGLFTDAPIGYHLMTLEESAEFLGTTCFLWGTIDIISQDRRR